MKFGMECLHLKLSPECKFRPYHSITISALHETQTHFCEMRPPPRFRHWWSCSGRVENKNICPCQKSNPGRSVRNLGTILTELTPLRIHISLKPETFNLNIRFGMFNEMRLK